MTISMLTKQHFYNTYITNERDCYCLQLLEHFFPHWDIQFHLNDKIITLHIT